MEFFYNCDSCNLRGHAAEIEGLPDDMEVVKRALRIVPVCECQCTVTSWVIIDGQSLSTMHFRTNVTARRADREVQRRIRRLRADAITEGSIRHAMLTTPLYLQVDGHEHRWITASQVIMEIQRIARCYQTVPVNVHVGCEKDAGRQVTFLASVDCVGSIRKLMGA